MRMTTNTIISTTAAIAKASYPLSLVLVWEGCATTLAMPQVEVATISHSNQGVAGSRTVTYSATIATTVTTAAEVHSRIATCLPTVPPADATPAVYSRSSPVPGATSDRAEVGLPTPRDLGPG